MARADIQSIIDRINAQAEGRQTGAFATRVYTDEPIVSRGSQMASYLPERIEQMRAIARNPEARMWPAAKLFYEQARVMEDYEDDVPLYSTFSHYFPTYEDMSNRDLRRYFSWRTQVRQGKVSPTSLSFVFVLFYELLCGVGVSDARDGFDKICSLWQSYRVFDGKLDRHAKRWLRDYAAWHNLPVELITPYVDLEFDQAVVALKRGLTTWREVSTLASSPVQDELLNAREALELPAGVEQALQGAAGHACGRHLRLALPACRLLRQAPQKWPRRDPLWLAACQELSHVRLGRVLGAPAP